MNEQLNERLAIMQDIVDAARRVHYDQGSHANPTCMCARCDLALQLNRLDSAILRGTVA